MSTRRWRTAQQAVLVLLTLAGLLGMHGLVGHAAEPVAATPGVGAAGPMAAMDHHGGQSRPAHAHPDEATAGAVCTDGCATHAAMGMGSTCLAFLSLLLLLLLPRRGVLATVATTDLLRLRPPAALAHRRAPPDLHRLSILRC